MTLTIVGEQELKELRKRQRKLGKVQAILVEFMNMDTKVVCLNYGKNEYKSTKNCRETYYQAIKRSGLPIEVHMIKNNVYLIRRDM